MKTFALGVSLTMAWCFGDEATPYSESVLGPSHPTTTRPTSTRLSSAK